MANQDRSTMLQNLRNRLMKKKGGFHRDPAEWRAPQVATGEEFKAKAFILPPLDRGEVCASGKAEMGMDGLFFTQVGDHWIERKKYPCPRVYDNDDCTYCQLGFNLLSETTEKTARSEVSKAYLPRTQYVVNLWFPDISVNPDDLRGQVKYYALPKTIFDKLEACIQNDDAGDDPDEPQAWGIFYDPQNAYPLSIKINRKGEYNSYTDSKLLATGCGAIADTQEEIDAILAQRHDLPAKFPERSSENLQSLQNFADALMNGASSGGSDDGFDSDETQESAPAPKAKSSTSAPKVKVKAKAKDPEPTKETIDVSESTQVDDDELQALLNSIKKSD